MNHGMFGMTPPWRLGDDCILDYTVLGAAETDLNVMGKIDLAVDKDVDIVLTANNDLASLRAIALYMGFNALDLSNYQRQRLLSSSTTTTGASSSDSLIANLFASLSGTAFIRLVWNESKKRATADIVTVEEISTNVNRRLMHSFTYNVAVPTINMLQIHPDAAGTFARGTNLRVLRKRIYR